MQSLRGAALLLVCAASAVSAQANAPDYPVKFVRFIVPYAPGGSSDVLARTLGQKLGEALGQTFVVDNRPGAGSMVGTDIAAKATPDGYTIILSDMPHTINPSIYAKVPYDPVKDFAPITTVGVSPMFLFVNPAVKAQNVKEFVALAKAQPGKLSIASGGTGATTHLMAELLQSHAGIKLTHVPYKGAGPALTDVVAGQIPRPLRRWPRRRRSRNPAGCAYSASPAPDAWPRFRTSRRSRRAASPGMIVEHWWGVMAPAGVPRSVIEKLRGAIVNAVNAADVRERFTVLAVEPRTNTPQEFRALLETDVRRWAQVVKAAGIKIE